MSENNVSLGEATQNAVSDNEQQLGQSVDSTNQEGKVQEAATEENDSGSDTTTASDDSSQESVKPKKGFEKRISKVVSERDRARQELEYWKEQALKQAQGQQVQTQPQVGQYTGKPTREMFASEDEYFEALSDFKVEQRLKEREFYNQQVKLVESYNTRAQEFAKERPDYFEIIEDAQDLIIAPETAYIIQQSEIGPRIALHLAENPEEADKLNRLDATRRIYELGKLESKLTAQPKKQAEVKKISTAPAPLTPVKGSAPQVSKDLYDPNITTAEWIALRAKKGRR